MNLLTQRPPLTVALGGRCVPIRWDFRAGIAFELLMQEAGKAAEEKLLAALALYFPEGLPQDLQGAVDAMLWFYRCGADESEAAPEEKKPEGGKRPLRYYCFARDADLLLAAFWEAYGIDLSRTEELHWWTFRALFLGLPEHCELRRIMGYRAMDTRGLSKREKQYYEKLKRQYALPERGSVAGVLTLAERDQAMKDYVAKRFAEASAQKSTEDRA